MGRVHGSGTPAGALAEFLAAARNPNLGGREHAPAVELDRINAAIVVEPHELRIAAPSTTQIGGRLAIRASFCNHRTEPHDVEALVEGVLALGRAQRRASRYSAIPAATETFRLSMRASISSLAR